MELMQVPQRLRAEAGGGAAFGAQPVEIGLERLTVAEQGGVDDVVDSSPP